MPNNGFDKRGFEAIIKETIGLKKEFEDWLIQFMTAVAYDDLLPELIKRTPIDTGRLKNSWKITKIERRGNEVLAWFMNDATDEYGYEYSSFVEYGHAWPYWGGIASDDDREWVFGRFFMRMTLQYMYAQLPKIYEREFKKFMKGKGFNAS